MSFNWEVYRELNPDLINAGLRTKQQFERHYIMYGKYEGRKWNKDVVNQKLTLSCDKKDIISYNINTILNEIKENNKDLFYDFNNKYNTGIYKIGLCFKIYVNDNTTLYRYNIIKDFLLSIKLLLDNYNNLTVVCIVDCIPNIKLNNLLSEYLDDRIKTIYLNTNKGISFATNIGIEYLLNENCDILFCSDDDVIFLNSDILNVYIKRMIDYNIPHLGFYENSPYVISYQIGELKINTGFSGAFYSILASAIYRYGYLPILQNKYGYEHEMFTKAITYKQFDIVDSSKYLKLNELSIVNKSGQPNINIYDGEKPLIKYISHDYFYKLI